MYQVLGRRAVQAASNFVSVKSDEMTGEPEPVNVFAVLLFMLTFIGAGVGFILFDYTFQVVKILCIVEDLPSDYMLAPSYDATDGTEPELDAEVPKIANGLYLGGTSDVKEKYITSSFRRTIRYLREEAGFFSAWRGFWANLVYACAASVLNGIFMTIFPFPFGRYIAGVFVMMAVSPLSLVHTHVVMALPTKETWFGRLARMPFKSIVHTLPAAAMVAVTGQATYAFPQLMLHKFVPQRNFDDIESLPSGDYSQIATPLQCLAIYSVFLASHVLLFVPAMIVLFRVQASVFPMEEESIIPFERKGPISAAQAWKTYTWEAKKRLLKLYAKIMPLTWFVALCVGTLLFFELKWVMGGKGYYLAKILHTWLKNQNGSAP